MALRHCNHHHAVIPCAAKAGEELWIVARPGPAAVAFQHQTLNAAVEQAVENLGTDPGKQRQHRDFRQLLRLVVVQRDWDRRRLHTTALTLQAFERMAAEAAHFRAAGRRQQFAVEVQVHARRQALAEGDQRAAEVFPGIAVGHTRRQHRAGETHAGMQAEQLKTHRRRAVRQRVGAVQDQHAVAALHVHGIDHRFAQLLPVGRGHVGAVDQRRHFPKLPLRHYQLRLAVQIVAHPRFETGRRGQPVGAGLHADGATGVEHHDVLSGGIGRRAHRILRNDEGLAGASRLAPAGYCITITDGRRGCARHSPVSVALQVRLAAQFQSGPPLLAG